MFAVIFLGVTKALVACFASFITGYSDLTAFHDDINPFLEDIASFRLDYCVMKTLPNTLWVSENYIALARILPWVFGYYCANFKPKQSSNAHCSQQWQIQVDAFQQLFNAYSVMVSTLMSRDKPDYDILDQQIKIFLTTCTRLDAVLTGDTSFWAEKGNFYSLLNLPEQIKKFGPLRDWWVSHSLFNLVNLSTTKCGLCFHHINEQDGDYEYAIQRIRPDLKRVRRSMETYFKKS